MKRWKLFTIFFLGICGIAFLYGWTEFHRGQKDTSVMTPDFQMNAPQLVVAFQQNEADANKTFNDKVVAITGVVSDVATEDNVLNVLMDGSDPMSGVLCQFDVASMQQARHIAPGQKIEIKGICTGMLTDVVLVRCVLVSEKNS